MRLFLSPEELRFREMSGDVNLLWIIPKHYSDLRLMLKKGGRPVSGRRMEITAYPTGGRITTADVALTIPQCQHISITATRSSTRLPPSVIVSFDFRGRGDAGRRRRGVRAWPPLNCQRSECRTCAVMQTCFHRRNRGRRLHGGMSVYSVWLQYSFVQNFFIHYSNVKGTDERKWRSVLLKLAF